MTLVYANEEDKKNGWTLSFEYLQQVQKKAKEIDDIEKTPSLEQIESVLLAYENSKEREEGLKVKKMHPDAVLPKYAQQGDSCFDLVAVEDVIIEPGETKLIKTGLAFDIPEGFEIQVRPRSGITLKTKLRVQLGTVDVGYKGEVGAIVDNVYCDCCDDGEITYKAAGIDEEPIGDDYYPYGTYLIRKGDRIAQGILAPVARAEFEEVDKLSESERGVSGYGSTGVKYHE